MPVPRRRPVPLRPAAFLIALAATTAAANDPPIADFGGFDHPVHGYWSEQPEDPFTGIVEGLEAGRIAPDRGDEDAFLRGLLDALDVPVSSQLLVFSTTSLQLRFISARTPRAIYFNEDVYVGHAHGGRIEVISIDPRLGAIFHIFDVPRGGEPLRIERSRRCMNCHVDTETRDVPGLSLRSVVPGPNGGTLDAFRVGEIGHEVPLSERFGGWHVTGGHAVEHHWGDRVGRLEKGELIATPNPIGSRFELEDYPVPTSDILAHLVLEHQAGFINRAIEATYATRWALSETSGLSDGEVADRLGRLSGSLVRYLLFGDEAELPAGGIEPDPAYREAFLAGRRPDPEGRSLRDLDLETRLFRHRCSYMIHSLAFRGLPAPLKEKVFADLRAALEGASDAGDHLPEPERAAIRSILRATVSDLPAGW